MAPSSPTRRRRSGAATLACLLAVAGSGCAGRARPVEYSLPQGALLPVGSVPASDGRARFADVFCRVLFDTTQPDGSSWKPCDQYLAGAASSREAPIPPVPSGVETLFVGGVFSQCLEHAEVPLRTFDDVREHFADRLGIRAHYVPVHPNGSVEQNGRAIAAWLAGRPGDVRFEAFGHSKGGLDLLEAIHSYPDVARRIVALVTFATPVGGSRLPELFPNRLAGLPDELGDHWAVAFPVERLQGVVRWAHLVDRNRYPRVALAEAALRMAGGQQKPAGCSP